MKSSIVLVAAAFLCLVAFPTTTVGKNLRFWPKPTEGWPNPWEVSRNDMFRNDLFRGTSHKFSYGDSKVWKCTYSNGSAPAISISPSIPSTPSTPSPSTPKTSPPPPTPSPPTPKTSPPPPTPSPPPPTPKTSPPPPTPSPPPPTPKTSPPPPTPSLPPPTPKKSPSPPPPTPSLPPPTPKKSPSPPPPTPKKSPSPSPPSDDVSSSPSQPSNPPPPEHHYQNPWEHINSCMRNMGPVTICRAQMEFSFFTRLFQVSDYCCSLIVNMRNECDNVIWGFFTDPFFIPLVRSTCHVAY